jgi:phenylacetate-CoA ligase
MRVSPPTSTTMTWPQRLLAMQQQFTESERWSPQRMSRYQFQQLSHLLKHAYERIPFYRPRLADAGYRPGREVTAGLWSRLPVLTRRELQEQRDAFICAELPPGHGEISVGYTSGSMGMPLKIARSQFAAMYWSAITLREMLWHQRDFRLKQGAIRRDHEGRAFPPAGRRLPSWGSPAADVFHTGPGVLLDNRSTASEQADWLLREEPAYLVSFPSIIDELARHFRQRGLRPKGLKTINTMSEVVSPSLRAACREAFGVGIADMYSATETGYLALQCPVHDHYHVQSEALLVEVLNEAGRPCDPGEIGSVVATPFLNYAMPLIRYAIGDYATRGRSCSCGRNLPVLQEIYGRTRDLLVLPSGESRYVWIGLRTFAEIPDIVQHQVVQKTLLEIEVKLVVRRPLGSEGEADLRRRLAETMGEQFVFSFTYHDTIPRAPNGKFFAFISELPS